MNKQRIKRKPQKKKKHRLVDRIITNLIGVIGALALLYPLFSNFYSAWTQDAAVERYERTVKQASPADKQKAIKYISDYNDALHGQRSAFDTEAKYVDPFTANKQRQATEGATPKKLNKSTDKEIKKQMVGDLVGTLTIPKLNQRLPIFAGTSAYQLSRGVGLINGTSIPFKGKGVHSVIAGHRGLVHAEVFRNLDKLAIGDVFYADSNGQKYAYQVDNIRIVSPAQAADFRIDKDKNYMTLMTCTPYMINSHRLMVRGYQIPMNKMPKTWPSWLKPLLYALAAILLLVLLGWLVNRRRKPKQQVAISVLYPHPFIRENI